MINKIFALPVVEQLTPVLSRRQIDGADVIVVDHPRVKASVALNGAHLLSWKPEGEVEDCGSVMRPPSKRGCNPWWRTDLLAVVRPVRTAGFAFSRFCP